MKLPTKGKIVAYGRVSSHEQEDNQYAAEQQRDRLLAAKPDELFFDIESGNSKTRPEFNRMMHLVHQAEISLIIATRWDRLTRNEENYLALKTVLQSSNVRLYLLDQGEVDFTTASGELSADMQAIFAVHERRMLRERILRGHAYRRKRKAASARAPFGYVVQNECYVLDNRPIVCRLDQRPDDYLELYTEPKHSARLVSTSRADIAAEVVDLFQETRRPRLTLNRLYQKYGIECRAFVDVRGEKRASSEAQNTVHSKRQKLTNLVLAKELLLWSSSNSLIDWLQNPVLRGHTAYCKFYPGGGSKSPAEWEMQYDTHPNQRLITEETFREIQLILKDNRRKVGSPRAKFHLTGLVFCDRCGYAMGLKRSPEYQYYGCSTLGCSNRKCIRVEKLNEAIAMHIFKRAHQLAQDPSFQTAATQESLEITELRQQLEIIDQALERGTGEALKRARHDLLYEITRKSAEASLFNLENATAQQIMAHPQTQDLGFWHTRTFRERELLYDKLLKALRVINGEIVAVELKV